jgi:uncharacterized membrane protein
MNKAINALWGCLFFAMIAYLFFIQGSLPNRLAVHFDVAGNPNGYQNKSAFITQFCLFTFIINGLFLAFSWGISKLPTGIINIPWKEYWFANEERKIKAFEKIRAVLGLGGVFICTVFLVLEQVIYQANVKDPILSFPINGAIFAILTLSVFFVAFSFIITRPPE